MYRRQQRGHNQKCWVKKYYPKWIEINPELNSFILFNVITECVSFNDFESWSHNEIPKIRMNQIENVMYSFIIYDNGKIDDEHSSVDQQTVFDCSFRNSTDWYKKTLPKQRNESIFRSIKFVSLALSVTWHLVLR